MRQHMEKPPNFVDCLSAWLRINHPDWEVIDHTKANDNWGDGIFMHRTNGKRFISDATEPHIAVFESGVMDCCTGENAPTLDMAAPDFFDKLSTLLTHKEVFSC